MNITDKLSDEARERLIELMADSPTLIKLEGTEFEIKGLKNGTLMKICEEVVKMKKALIDENDKTTSVMLSMATNIPVMCRIITYAILNDYDKIKSNFQETYDIILNNTTQKDIFNIMFEVMQKLDVNFFFANTESMETLLTILTDRRMTTNEQKAL